MSNVSNEKRETEKENVTASHEKLARSATKARKTFIAEIERLAAFFFHAGKITEYESQFVLNANQSWELS